ncbi:MAG: FAD-dependent monooxygenase [Nocardiaceae bacterium]|nr:FAD-dependent monooxygenase [Nocardiaceae bacterium]
MKVACVGGGPAGLYFSILMKQRDPSHVVTVYERNPAGSTYGWGVTMSNGLLKKLRRVDPESALTIEKSSVRWDSWFFGVRDRATLKQGRNTGIGIGRRQLLEILAERARGLGVRIEYEHEITSEEEVADADLIFAGDGVNSVLRHRYADHFGERFAVGRNFYLWLGTTKVFESFTYSFVETEHGWIWAYGYKHNEDCSTCVVECAPATWRGLGFDQASEAASLAMLEKLFADILDGHHLIGRAVPGNTANWLRFRTLTNRTWHHDNLVLAGDAAHTTHYSLGVGTRLAFGDAAVLVRALNLDLPLAEALDLYERQRKATTRGASRSASRSARWYEHLPRYVDLPPEILIALFGRRRSVLLPFVPPRLYYRVDQAIRWLKTRGRRPGGN